ncbi:MAG: glycosyltransferase family 2 protein [Prevotellaceae bacterium]|jgi:dolichol-phosphate mannosyltransferase|nr:glycosyltransferase family 2 protein [Prevotellaceae bacterium]
MVPKEYNFAIIIPMANESKEFDLFISKLKITLDFIQCGQVYLIVDNASKDNTFELCKNLSGTDIRFKTVWAPENKNVVDAYIRGYKEAEPYHDIIIEMDAGMSHDPAAIPMFIRVLNEGNECAFGSRFINGGSIWQSSFKRRFLSKTGTRLSNILLGTRMRDMTSGYQGFHVSVVRELLKYQLLSKGHFYQTEVRYLTRKLRYMEVPIHYRAPSPSVSTKSILNSLSVLFHYFFCRLRFKSKSITTNE